MKPTHPIAPDINAELLAGVREAEVLAACLELLKLRGIFAWRNNTGALKSDGRFLRFGKVGSSDILAVGFAGRFWAIETKRPGGKPTQLQEAFLAAVRASGGVAAVVSDVADLARLLDRLEADPWATV